MNVWLSILSGFTAALLVAVGIIAFQVSRNASPAAIAADVAALKLTLADHTDRIEQLLRREKTLAARQSKEKAASIESPGLPFDVPAPGRKAAIRARIASRNFSGGNHS